MGSYIGYVALYKKYLDFNFERCPQVCQLGGVSAFNGEEVEKVQQKIISSTGQNKLQCQTYDKIFSDVLHVGNDNHELCNIGKSVLNIDFASIQQTIFV